MPVGVRLLSKYARLGASSRLRMLQYLPILDQLGIEIDPHPLFPDAYVKELYEVGPNAARARAGRHYVNRIRELWRVDGNDLDWVEGELLPYLPRWFEKAVTRSSRPFVVEYDDALFHRYDLSSNFAVRSILSSKIDVVMRDAACVIAGNRYLAERARRAGAVRVELVPTVVDATRYAPITHCEHRQLVIGWIGSPATQHYLLALHGVFKEVCRRYDARLMLVGARSDIAGHLHDIPLECVSWTESSEAALLSQMDVGIMPLQDGPWERGKCGYKLVQYMASGLPVLASPVGVNTDLVRSGINGFLPVDLKDWADMLSLLLNSVEIRQRLGAAGRARVEAELCTQVQAPRLAEIMREVAGR